MVLRLMGCSEGCDKKTKVQKLSHNALAYGPRLLLVGMTGLLNFLTMLSVLLDRYYFFPATAAPSYAHL